MTTEQDSIELSSQMRNSMMVFVAKFLFIILPPLIAVFFYILTMTKNDVEITTKNEITKIEQAYQSKIARMEILHDKIEQAHLRNTAEVERLKARVNACKKNCDIKNLELKISEKRTISDRFKMNFNVDKKKVEFRFEEIKQ